MLKKNITALSVSFAMTVFLGFLSTNISWFSIFLPLGIMVVFSVGSAVADKEYVAISAAISALFFYVLFDDVIMLYTTVVCATAGIVIGCMIKKNMSVMSLTIASAIGWVALSSLFLYIYARMGRFGSLGEMIDSFSETMKLMVSLTDGQIDSDVLNAYLNSFRNLFPSIVIISAMTVGYLVVFLTGAVLSLGKKEKVVNLGFSVLKVDRITTYVFITSMIVTLFTGYDKVGIIAENVYTILSYILQICGISLLDWFLKNIKRMNLLLRVVIIIFVSSLPFTSVLFVMIALLDARRNFRGLSE